MQSGDGAHAVYVEGGGRGILEAATSGAAVKVTLHNAKGHAYKGLNVFAVDGQGKAIGDWPQTMQAPGLRVSGWEKARRVKGWRVLQRKHEGEH